MADDFDYQINSLKFRDASSDRFPYERGTAPFRKDQFDSSPTVGDQSLAGWWTRGQLSFHKGAGVKYLDLQQGDTLNTFWYGRDIQVMRPGEVWPIFTAPATARRAFTAQDLQQFDNISDFGVALYVNSSTGGVTYLNGSGNVSAMTATDIAPAGSDEVVNLALDLTQYVYTGMSDGSVERVDLFTDTASTFWTHSGGVNIDILFDEARNRLWVLNENDFKTAYLYMLDTVGGAFTTADGQQVPRDSLWGTHIAIVPSGLLLAAGTRVMLISVDEDGTVAPAVQVAETTTPITSMCYHNGQVVLGCRDGFRLSELTGNELIYGPAFGPIWAEGNDYTSLLVVDKIVGLAGKAYAGCRWYIEQTPGTGVEYSGIIQINLDDQADLVAAWSEFVVNMEGAGALSTFTFPSVFRSAIMSSFDGEMILHPTDTGTATDAYLVTGYHRLGTLEPKRFHSVTVKAQGTAGSISVAVIDEVGIETSLGTLTITNTGDVQIVSQDFAMPTTLAERFALKFSWDASSSTSPALVGYQVRALPAPERQRILRWPLLIQDKIRLRRGVTVGKKGRAYSDVTALEALESSVAVVTFTDHRTGETGTAYVDSVEFQADTPSTDNTNGFGGVAYVTLRVLT